MVSWIVIVLVIGLVFFSLRCLYSWWKKRKLRNEVVFEMSSQSQRENRPNARGYGEFVDEAQ